jgi:hypothetical protein
MEIDLKISEDEYKLIDGLLLAAAAKDLRYKSLGLKLVSQYASNCVAYQMIDDMARGVQVTFACSRKTARGDE